MGLFSKKAAAPKPGAMVARPPWSTELSPDKNGSPQPPRAGVAFLDARVALAPPKELGLLMMALAKAEVRPVLVPSVAKIVGSILKQRGNQGVLRDRAIIENHIKGALDAVKAPESMATALNPALDMYWMEEKKYALPDKVEEQLWLAMVNGVDERPDDVRADVKNRDKQPPESLKQTGDRLTIINEIVTVCRNTKGPHLLITSDGVIQDSAVKDVGGHDLEAMTIDMGMGSSLPFRSAGDAEALINKLMQAARANASAGPAPQAPQAAQAAPAPPDQAPDA